jgi:SAM-dependent methyltransferase
MLTNTLARRIAYYWSMGPHYLLWRMGRPLAAPALRMALPRPVFAGHGLEIGGPSEIFAAGGLLPVYPLAMRIDNITYSGNTHWEGEVRGGPTFHFDSGREPGSQFILEAGATDGFAPASYDFIISSHMLEHSANPLGVLTAWRRLLRAAGHLLLVLPHRDGTFDHRRPVTSLEHLRADAERNMSESDATHLPEILELHDLRRDPTQTSRASFEQWIGRNAVTRGAHHHVFDTRTAARMLDSLGFQLLEVEAAMPHHIVLLARRGVEGDRPDNARFLLPTADCYRSSPFGSDRKESKHHYQR